MEQWQRLQNKLSKDKHNKGTFYGKEEKQYHEILGDGFDANSQFILSFTIAPFYIVLEGFFCHFRLTSCSVDRKCLIHV